MRFNQMVKSQRARNNRIHKDLDESEVKRIANEMLQIAINEFGFDGLDVAPSDVDSDVYDRWEEINGKLEPTVDDNGDEDEYNKRVFDELEDVLYDYADKAEHEVMNAIEDLEYNDKVEFVNGTYYVKGTNGRGSYTSCMIWAGPHRNDDEGWYFHAYDFIEVVERSESGERLSEFY